MKLTQFAVDERPHTSDGLALRGWPKESFAGAIVNATLQPHMQNTNLKISASALRGG